MDDLVAELTLRFRNELSAGLDEVRGEFGGLDAEAATLRTTLGGLMAELEAMRAPVGFADSFTGVDTEIKTVIGSVEGIGAAIDGDIVKVNELKAAIAGVPSMIPPQYGIGGQVQEDNGAPAFIPPGSTPPGGGDEPGEPSKPGKPKSQKGWDNEPMEAPGSNWLMELIAVGAGYNAWKDYAKFQETALQIAIIEGYHGADAKTQAQSIMHESYNQAYLSRSNVDDVEQAYFNLIRQQLPKALVDQMMGPLTEAATTYSTPVADITQPMFNLAEQFKIPGEQMPQAVAMLGAASHMGHYYFADFGVGLPTVANQFAKLGDTGLDGEATAAAALEMVRRGTSDSSTASTDLSYLMTYMTSSIASRFFDRTKRSQDLLGEPIMDLFEKYHIHPLNLPEYFDSERAKGIDPLNAMVDYMHTIGADKMSATDQGFVFNSLFHSTEASTAMQALLQNYDLFKADQQKLRNVPAGFLDENFETAIQGDQSGVSTNDTLFKYLYRLYGQNTFGLLGGSDGASQAGLGGAVPGASAFNIPINLTVNVDKSGGVTANATPAPGPLKNPAGVNLNVNQGNMLVAP